MRKKKSKIERTDGFVATTFTHTQSFEERCESFENYQLRHKIEAEVLSRCEEIVKAAKSSWYIKTPEQMADHCIDLIRQEKQRKGITPIFPKWFINDLKAKKILR